MVYDPREHGAKCDRCPLNHCNPVPPERGAGVTEQALASGGSIVLVGEAPGEQEERTGVPFVGKSGEELNKALYRAGFARQDALVTNTMLCRPPKNRLRDLLTKINAKNRAAEKKYKDALKLHKKNKGPRPEPPELIPSPIDCCKPRLDKEIENGLNFITLGKTATQAVTGASASIMAVRGGLMHLQATERTTERKVMPTVHPAFCLRKPRWFHVFYSDVEKAGRWFRGESKWREPNILRQPGPAALRAFLARHRGQVLTFDIETDGIESLTAKIRCIAVGDVDEVAVCSFLGKDGKTKFYPRAVEREMIAIFKAYFEDESQPKCGHNAGYYDKLVLRSQWHIDPKPIVDTILLHRVVESELPHGLGYVGSMYTDAPSWKTDREGNKLSTDSESDEELATYCLFEGTRVVLGDGSTSPIEDLVRQKYAGDVLSLTEDGRVVRAKVTGWHYNVEDDVDWRVITVEGQRGRDRGLVLTADHRVWTKRGWVQASELEVGDRMVDHETQLTLAELQSVAGSVAGDGSLVVSPVYRQNMQEARTASFVVSHASASELAQWKAEALPSLALGQERPACTIEVNGRKGKAGPVQPARTPQLRQLMGLVKIFYDATGQRRLTTEGLDFMGVRGLAWLYADDGGKQKRTRERKKGWLSPETMVFNTQGFPRQDIDRAVAWFRDQYGPTSAGADGVIRLGARASRRAAKAIAPYVPPPARYKLPDLPGIDWDDYPYRPLPTGEGRPSERRVLAVAEFVPDTTTRHGRYRARRRYCLDVEGTHNFFTTYGLVHNCCFDVAVTARVLEPLINRASLVDQVNVFKLDQKVQAVCADMHTIGMYVDQEVRLEQEKHLLARRHKYLETIREMVGIPDFNPGSIYQVSDILFERWQLDAPLDDEDKYTASDNLSTSDLVLRSLLMAPGVEKHQRDFIKQLRYYRKVQKVLGTYVVKLRPWNVKIEKHLGWDDNEDWNTIELRKRYGLEKKGIVNPYTGRMHPGYNAHVAVTGRLSSSKPINSQNFPKLMRAMVTAAPGHMLVGADMDQLELRIAAARWGVELYLRAFAEGKDPHSMTAFSVFGEAFCKAAGITAAQFDRPGILVGPSYDPHGKFIGTGDDMKMRNLSKAVQYASQYMAAVGTVHQLICKTEVPARDEDGNVKKDGTTDLPYAKMRLRRVREMRQNWLEGAFQFETGWAQEIDFFKERGFVQEYVTGRKRDFLDAAEARDDKLGGVNEIVNFPIQGSAAGLMNKAILDVHKAIPPFKWGPGTGIINQCHDSIVVECPADGCYEYVDEKTGKTKVYVRPGSIPETVGRLLEEAMNQTHPALPGVTFTASAAIGKTWKQVG